MPKSRISEEFIAESNRHLENTHNEEYSMLGDHLAKRNIDIEAITKKTSEFFVALPSWAVATGGTRFGSFPEKGEPRNIFDRLEDCSVIQSLGRATPKVCLHIPWDKEDPKKIKDYAEALQIGFDAINSNTFSDTANQEYSYKYGSLSHTDPKVRRQAIDHNIECIKIGDAIGSKSLNVWVGDGSNFPGQTHFIRSFERYLDSMAEIYKALPDDWLIYSEHKIFEPAFYSSVVQDWGTSYLIAQTLGEKAYCLVDLGHHSPNVNIEMIVARLLQFGKLGGFHFNDCKYADDDLDAGSIAPYRLFLVLNELVDAEYNKAKSPALSNMIDQSHNVTDPIESLISSANEIRRAYTQALLVDREALETYQIENDALMASETLKRAFRVDVSAILAEARRRTGGAIDPIATYRKSMYRQKIAVERPLIKASSGAFN